MKKVTEDRERKKRERKKREKKERQRERRNYEKTERINVKDDDKEGGEEIEKTEPLPEDSHSTANPEPFKSHEMNKINQTRIKGDDLVIFKELIATVNEFSIETKKKQFFFKTCSDLNELDTRPKMKVCQCHQIILQVYPKLQLPVCRDLSMRRPGESLKFKFRNSRNLSI